MVFLGGCMFELDFCIVVLNYFNRVVFDESVMFMGIVLYAVMVLCYLVV